MPTDAVVERSPASTTGAATLVSAEPGERATVWTAPAPAMTGADAALMASRVPLRGA